MRNDFSVARTVKNILSFGVEKAAEKNKKLIGVSDICLNSSTIYRYMYMYMNTINMRNEIKKLQSYTVGKFVLNLTHFSCLRRFKIFVLIQHKMNIRK